MQRGKFLRSSNLQLFARFEIVNRLVLSAVILEDTVHVFHPRYRIQEDYKNEYAEQAIDAIEKNGTLKAELRLQQTRDYEGQGNE